MTFAERYCARHHLPDGEFERVVLFRSLHPAARLFGAVLRLLQPDFFSVDLELVRQVGRLTRVRDFSPEASGFWHHPVNTRWLRRNFGLRLSTHRLLRLLQATLHSHDVAPSREAAPAPSTPCHASGLPQ